jgi:hypothetical protein
MAVTYSALDTVTNNYFQAVQPPQCQYDPPCKPSAWYPVTRCDNALGCLSQSAARPELAYGTQIINRSFTNPPGQQGDCFNKDEDYFWSISICSFSDNPQNGLQSCTQCLWAQKVLSPVELASMCNAKNGSSLFIGQFPNDLVSQTNVKGDSCANYRQECDYLTLDRSTCSILTRPCNDVSMCPRSTAIPGGPGPPTRVCGGKGTPEFYINTDPATRAANPLVCSCSCFSSFTGPSCTTARTPCPLGIDGLECSGFGTCNAGVCTCDAGIPQTPNCQDIPWCWVYGNVQGTANGTASQYRKLLGAIPLRPGYFDTTSCLNVNQDITSRLPTTFTVQYPTPLTYNLELLPNSNIDFTQSLYKAALETTVQSYAPPNMIPNQVGCLNYDPIYTTEKLIGLVLTSSSSFKPLLVPNTVPSRCENILTFSAFSLTNVPFKPIPRPLITSNTGNFSKLQYTVTKMLTLSQFSTSTKSIFNTVGDEFTSYVDFGDIKASLFTTPYRFNYFRTSNYITQTFAMTISGSMVSNDGGNFSLTSITFPWLSDASPVQPWFKTPNDADLYGETSISNCFSESTVFPYFVFNTNCPGIRNVNTNFKTLDNSVVIESFNFFSFTQVIDPNWDPSFNHPFCTDPTSPDGTVLQRKFGQASITGGTAAGSRFLCQISRHVLSRGVGIVMPVQFVYTPFFSGAPNQ